MDRSADKARNPARPVPTGLVIGIALLPFVFAWFLLRPGYSVWARVLAFGWLGVCLILFALPRPGPVPSRLPTPTPTSTPVASEPISPRSLLPYVHELSLKTTAGGQAAPRQLSTNAKQLRALWLELEGFKHDPKFHALGFDNPFQYGEWRGKVRTLDDRAGKSLIAEIGFSPGELLMLGEEYLRNKGLGTGRSDAIVQRFDAALNPGKAAKGEGRVARDTEGCEDFDPLAQSLRQMETGDFQGSNASLDAASCVSIPAGTIVSAPSARRGYDWLKDTGQRVYVLVEVQQSHLWLPEDEISF